MGPALRFGGVSWAFLRFSVRSPSFLRFPPCSRPAACVRPALAWPWSVLWPPRPPGPARVGLFAWGCRPGRPRPPWRVSGPLVFLVLLLPVSVRPPSSLVSGLSPCLSRARVWRSPGGWPVSESSALVGFCGSRWLPPSFAPLVASVVSSVLASGRGVAVGCASGADRLVLAAAPGARLFAASSFSGPPVARLVARSVACVRAVAGSGPCASFVGFVSSACPPSVRPSPSPSACFCGGGSGSWASLALAVGLGLRVVVFWCGSGPPALPAWGGSWVVSGWGSGWRFVPAPVPAQPSLF